MSNFKQFVRTTKLGCGKANARFVRMVDDDYFYRLTVKQSRTLTGQGIRDRVLLYVTLDLVGTESAQGVADAINTALGNQAGRALRRMEVVS